MTTLEKPAALPALARLLPSFCLSRSEAQARVQLAQRVRDFAVQVAHTAWHMTLEPISEMPVQVPGECLLVHANWAGAAFRILLPARAAQVWIASRFPETDLPALPDSYLAMVLESALDDVVASLSGLQRGPARVESVTQNPPAALSAQSLAAPVCPHAFEILLSGQQGSLLIHLATDALGLMLMAGLTARLPIAANAVPVDDLPVLLRAEIGFAWLNAQDIGTLKPGDTVLLTHAFLQQEQRLWLAVDGRWGMMVKPASSHSDGFEVTQTFGCADLSYLSTFTQSFMAHPDSNALPANSTANPTSSPISSATSTLAAIETIPFRVAFDLGERTMTLGEIKALQCGQPLTLDRPLSQAVSMRVNGMLIGQGELVEIDGRLGVAITVLAGTPAPKVGIPSHPEPASTADQ